VATQDEDEPAPSDCDRRGDARYRQPLVTEPSQHRASPDPVHARIGVHPAGEGGRDVATEGGVVLELRPQPELLVHGCVRISALVLMVDMGGGFSAHRAAFPDWTFTSDLSVRIEARPAPERIVARTRVLRAGRGTMMTEVDLRGDDSPLGIGYAGFNRQPRREGDHPNPDIDEAARRWGRYTPLEASLVDTVGVHVVDAATGHVEVAMRDDLRNPAGALQGAMVSIVGEVAAETLLAHHGASRAVITDIDIRYLAMGRVGPIQSRARLLGDKPTDAVAVELFDRGNDDRIISVMLLRGAPAPS
jgi:acyl-coenzyme A thioesterase PaaI-like protein